jgi:hypothetical protein
MATGIAADPILRTALGRAKANLRRPAAIRAAHAILVAAIAADADPFATAVVEMLTLQSTPARVVAADHAEVLIDDALAPLTSTAGQRWLISAAFLHALAVAIFARDRKRVRVPFLEVGGLHEMYPIEHLPYVSAEVHSFRAIASAGVLQ